MAKLYFRYGAMNCGKSTSLLQVAYNYKEQGFEVITLKPIIDTKIDDSISSRTGLKLKVNYCFDKQDNLYNKIKEQPKCILVDEAQFLTKEQVNQLHKIAHLRNIPVICYGLRTDFQMNGFEGASRLLEIADTIEEMKTICKHCGKKATMNIRLINDKPVFTGEQIEIDNQDEIKYSSVCSEYYYELRKDK